MEVVERMTKTDRSEDTYEIAPVLKEAKPVDEEYSLKVWIWIVQE